MSERDAARMREAIAAEYGFVPTLAFCANQIAFVDAMTKGSVDVA